MASRRPLRLSRIASGATRLDGFASLVMTEHVVNLMLQAARLAAATAHRNGGSSKLRSLRECSAASLRCNC